MIVIKSRPARVGRPRPSHQRRYPGGVENPRVRLAVTLGMTAMTMIAVACGGGGTTEQAGPSASAKKGGLGRAAANIPEDESTTSSVEDSTTSSVEESTTTASTAAPPPSVVTTVVTVTQPPPTQPPPTQPPPTQTYIINNPGGPSESPPRLTANGSASCPAGKATINWTGTNLSSVTITFNGATVATGGGSGSTTVDYACGSNARYNLAGSNSAGSASAYVDVFST